MTSTDETFTETGEYRYPECADCGDHGSDVVEDQYPMPLCGPCTDRRFAAGCDDAERRAYRDATGVA